MYWLVALPLLDGVERTWSTLQQGTTYNALLASNHRFSIPELRVGTLDTLMVLSDDLIKVNAMLESVVNKIRRQVILDPPLYTQTIPIYCDCHTIYYGELVLYQSLQSFQVSYKKLKYEAARIYRLNVTLFAMNVHNLLLLDRTAHCFSLFTRYTMNDPRIVHYGCLQSSTKFFDAKTFVPHQIPEANPRLTHNSWPYPHHKTLHFQTSLPTGS